MPQARPRCRCPAPETNLSYDRAGEQLLEPPHHPVSRRGPGHASPLALSSPPSAISNLCRSLSFLQEDRNKQELTRGLPCTSPPRIDLAPRSSSLGQEHLVVLDLATVGDQHQGTERRLMQPHHGCPCCPATPHPPSFSNGSGRCSLAPPIPVLGQPRRSLQVPPDRRLTPSRTAMDEQFQSEFRKRVRL
ncbi:uncharacterized protein LOC123441792 [Hordeum vulgare subsp. vulgare]|uniref:uncharacterized protein LOC123441792 n=1 Tax=Hordeum vulgare subsp. vulgare TaxID=112509 RepID=UPI001D1A4065|nr:uncharacterized protein LOC123441792 [Hordeum vulgare subsp. vulgare]